MEEEVKKQIESMLEPPDDLVGQPPEGEPMVGEGEGEPTGEGEPGGEPSTEGEPPKESADERLLRYQAQIEDLTSKVNKLVETKKAPEPEPKPLTLEDQDFLADASDDDVYDLMKSKTKLNALLNKVYKAGIEVANKTVSEGVLRSIPSVVRANVETMSAMKQHTDKFYRENKDLVPFKKVVATVFEEIASEHPDYSFEKALTEVEKEARKRLNLAKGAAGPIGPRQAPAPKGRVAAPTKKDLSPLLKEIEEMNSIQ